MSLRKSFFVICPFISTLCLAAGYGLSRQWMGMIVAILLSPVWLFARKYPNSGLPFVYLSVSVGLAAIGILTGSQPLWMIFGSASALAAWDLVFLDSAVGNNSSGEQNRRYENKHLQSLLLALGFALLASVMGRFVNIQLPFFVLLLSLVLILFGLDRFWGYIKKRAK